MNLKRLVTISIVIIFAVVSRVFCQTPIEQRLDQIEAKMDTLLSYHRDRADVDETEEALRDDSNLFWGVSGRQGTILDKDYFVVNHCDEWKIPYWVAYFLSASNLQGDATRTNDFRADPQLATDSRSELTDYRYSGYDRGHNAPAAAFRRSRAAMSTTFLLSNMSPQTPRLNRSIWRILEQEVRQTVNTEGEGWIITGNVSLDADSNFVDPPDSIGGNNVGVPTHCFKAILIRDDNENYFMYAFLLPNQRDHVPGVPADYMLTIDRLEEITGYDFFPLLDDQIEDDLENVMPGIWPR